MIPAVDRSVPRVVTIRLASKLAKPKLVRAPAESVAPVPPFSIARGPLLKRKPVSVILKEFLISSFL